MAVNKLDITMMEDVGTSANQLVQRDGSGNMPAVDGSQVSGLSEFTTSTSDPTISTNPSGGVGSLWYNKTSGEMYVCTDATAGANVWTNVGAGSGNIVPYSFQGSSYGYFYGGTGSPTNKIDRVSFTSDGNATDVGDILSARKWGGGCSTATFGYMLGGEDDSAKQNVIQKYSFTADGNSTDVADLTTVRSRADTSSSSTHGYSAGGRNGNPVNIIEKFSFSAGTNATDVGDLLAATKEGCGGVNSTTYGYHCQGYAGPLQNVIEKLPFSSDANSTDVGNTIGTGDFATGASSTTHGYNMGGEITSSSPRNIIEKFSFSSDGNATDIADLTRVSIGGARGGIQV